MTFFLLAYDPAIALLSCNISIEPVTRSQDPIYPNCCLEVQDIRHWLCKCPALMTVRQRVSGNHQGSLEWFATRPGDVVMYAKKILDNLDA